MKPQLRERLFDSILEDALADYANEQASLLLTEEELRAAGQPIHTFSPAFEANMEKELAKHNRKLKRRAFVRALPRAAACFVVLLGVSIGAAMQVDAFRVPLTDFFTRTQTLFTEMFADDVRRDPTIDFISLMPTYVPEGFAVEQVKETVDGVVIEYQNEDKTYYMRISHSSSTFNMDTEDAVTEEISIHGYPAFLSIKETKSLALYRTPYAEYFFSGTLDRSTLLEILYSIPLQK